MYMSMFVLILFSDVIFLVFWIHDNKIVFKKTNLKIALIIYSNLRNNLIYLFLKTLSESKKRLIGEDNLVWKMLLFKYAELIKKKINNMHYLIKPVIIVMKHCSFIIFIIVTKIFMYFCKFWKYNTHHKNCILGPR